MSRAHIIGTILGTAVGDAIGLPYEGLSRRRGKRLFGPPDRHRFLFGRGMVSDDTEHTCMVAQALIASGCGVGAFRRSLGWRLRFWLLGLPAGVGSATLRAILRLWAGFSPERSGVFSAGNGPAMRAAILGAAIEDDVLLRELVTASSRTTHTDPKAEYAALAVAVAAQTARRHREVSGEEFLLRLRSFFDGVRGPESEELLTLLEAAAGAADEGQSTESFAASLGLADGVSGYAYHSVPVAIHAWLRHARDFRSAITSTVRCGGDTDTTAAIAGGIVGAAVGRPGIPEDWLQNLAEWPMSVTWMERLGAQLADTLESGRKSRPVRLPPWGILPRNLFFIIIVVYHGVRQLFPPYR